MNLAITLRAELIKTKKTASFYLTLVAASFGPLMSSLDLLLDGIPADKRQNLLNEMLIEKFQLSAGAVLPLFLVLICTLLPQIEYRNNSWKQVLASPQSKGDIFLSKFFCIQILTLLFLVANQLVMLGVALFLHLLHPELHIWTQPFDGSRYLVSLANSYGVVLALGALQFWMGLRFRNFIAPIGIGVAGWFFGILLAFQIKSGFPSYFPYSFSVFGSFPQFAPQLPRVLLTSLIYTVVFLGLGFWDFSRLRKR